MSVFDIFKRGREFGLNDALPFFASPEAEKNIEIKKLSVNISVCGLYSETTQEFTFYNPNKRDLACDLCLPLPDGASVCGYALDVNGGMVDGVIVPKAKARQVLETEIRKGVDPGLVEHVEGNVYRTRVYPVPSEGCRTIRITYISDLALVDNNAFYHLPLSHLTQVESISLKLEVKQNPVKPEVGGFGNLSFNQWDDVWSAQTQLTQQAISEDLLVCLPSLPDTIMCVENSHNSTFFNISCSIKPRQNKAWKVKEIGIIWDASGSRVDHDSGAGIKKELALLIELEKCWPEARVNIQLLRDVLAPEVHHFNSLSETVIFLETVQYDGATDLSALNFKELPAEIYFIFSDGINSAKSSLPEKANKPLFSINSHAVCDSHLLAYLAKSSGGGQYINLLRMPIDDAIKTISDCNTTHELTALHHCEAVYVSESNSRLSIIGKLTGVEGSVSIGSDNNEQHHFTVSQRKASNSHCLAKAWAGEKSKELSLQTHQEQAILMLARQFNLVTPDTSLLVLESLEQYLEHDIEPPAMLPDMLAQYRARKTHDRNQEKEKNQDQLNQIVHLWERRIEWWNTDFKASYKSETQDPFLNPPTEGFNSFSASPESIDPFSNLVVGSPQSESFDIQEDAFGLSEMLDEDDSFKESGIAQPLTAQATIAPCASIDDTSCNVRGNKRRLRTSNTSNSAKKPQESKQASIQLKAWSADTPYLDKLKAGDGQSVYHIYLEQRNDYANSPAFFLDCSDYFFGLGKIDLAKRILSNLIEMQLEDIALLRVYAWRLQQAGELTLALKTFERIRILRDDEPQSHRDLALALVEQWQVNLNDDDATRAMHLLYDVVCKSWPRFPEIELIALMELNKLIYLCEKKSIAIPIRIDPRLIQNLDLDLRISLSWDADLTDVDLHVFEPDGGHAYYAHNQTQMGGLVSRDFTQGYGPEEYVLHHALSGEYTIKAHYFGSHQQTLCGPCTLTATIFTNYGRENENKQTLTLRLEKASNEELLGTVNIGELIQGNKQENPDTLNDLKKFKTLKKGMSMDEVNAIVGQPYDIGGCDEIVLYYRLDNTQVVELVFDTKLSKVQLQMNGSTLTLL